MSTPSRQEMISKIRERAIEVNPEIVELKFGCEFQAGASTMIYLETENYAVNNIGFWRAYFCSKNYHARVWEGERLPSPTTIFTGEDFERIVKESISRSDAFSNTFPDIEIIGRPIRLADVLWMLGRVRGNMFVDEVGCFVKPYRKEFTYDYVVKDSKNIKWDLLKDNLNDQEDATVTFIYELIK